MIFARFNPRSREGSDRNGLLHDQRPQQRFNPRSREGSDQKSPIFFTNINMFQSTLP